MKEYQCSIVGSLCKVWDTQIQARSQAEAEEAAASSDLAQIDNVLIMCSHDITYHFNIWTLCHSLVKKNNL